MHKEIEADPILAKIKQDVISGTASVFTIEEGKLIYKGRLVIPKGSPLILTLLQEYHNSPMGHEGETKTYLRMAKDWYWHGMRRAVADFVKRCCTCKQYKSSQQCPAGLLQQLSIPTRIWKDISMDFIEGLPLSKGINSILVVVDRLSKYSHFLGLKHPFNAVKVAEVFVDGVVRLHGFPATIAQRPNFHEHLLEGVISLTLD